MKKILSTVLALCMILGCVAVGFTAQAGGSEAALQAGINDAIANGTDYTWTGETVHMTQPLTINGDVKIDFKGATLLGAPHMFTVDITGGNVELFDVYMEGKGAEYDGVTGFADELNKARPTLNIGNATVTLTNAYVAGASINVYSVGEPLPLSDAISMWGADGVLNLNNARVIGTTAVNNKRGSQVNVSECIVAGYYKDFADKDNVNYDDGLDVFDAMDFITDALADRITLTAGEEKYMTKFFENFLQVTAAVKAQPYAEPEYDYDPDAETLTITVKADKSFGDTKYLRAFDYVYIPKTAVIEAVSNEEHYFEKIGDFTYAVTFEDVPAGLDCDIDLYYTLGFDVAEDAQELVYSTFMMMQELIASIPGRLVEVDYMLNDAIDEYLTGDQGIATLLWNLYNTDGALEAMVDGMSEQEQAKAKADIKAMLGPVFDICGIELRAGNNTDSTLYKAIKAVREGTASDRQKSNVQTMVEETNRTYGSSLTADLSAGKDLGKGLIGKFLDYWTNIKDLTVNDEGGFNDIKGLGEYLGANYDEMYNGFLKGGVKPCIDKIAALLADDSNFVIALLADNNIDLSGITDLTAFIDKLITYADWVFASNTFNEIVRTYGQRVPQYCGIYLDKAFTIANNTEVYFDIQTEDNYLEFFEFPQEVSYTTPSDVEMLTVTVNVSGFGKYSVDGYNYTTTQVFDVPMGSDFVVEPVEMGDEVLFNYFAISDVNGNARLSPTGGELTVYSNTIITLYFLHAPLDIDIVFMTNYELSSQYINTFVSGEIEELPEAPAFEGADFLGWALENVSGAEAQVFENDSAVIEMANMADRSMTFYAIYKFEKMTVASSLLENTLTMKESFVGSDDHQAYFTVLFSDRALEDGDVIVEAGVLAAGSEETIEAATPNGGAGIIKGNLNLDLYDLPAFYTYAVHFNNHSTDRTAYAKGFVIIQHADGTFDTEYTTVQSQVIPAY